MILLLAVVAGLFAGALRAWHNGTSLHIPELQWLWLVPIAFLPQWAAFYFGPTSVAISDTVAAVGLVVSQIGLLVFVWVNRRKPGFWALGIGLGLNFVVILLNGGLMPISPETVTRLAPNASPDAWQVGERLGTSKDVVLPVDVTRLRWLSDRFVLPAWTSYPVAFSVGDVLIAIGTFWLLWTMGTEER